MSQNSNGGPNYDPYGPGPSNPNYPLPPGTAYGGGQPPSGPNPNYGQPPSGPNYGQYAPPPPPPDVTPHSGYGSYGASYPPASNPGMEQMAGPYDLTVFSQGGGGGATYPSYPPPATPGLNSPPSQPGFNTPPVAPGLNALPNTPVFGMPPAPQQPTRKMGGRTMLFSIIGLVLIVIGVLGVVFYNQSQTGIHNANATATAQTQAQAAGTAHAVATATGQAQATATAVRMHYPFSNTLVLNDPLSDNSGVAKYGWDVGNGCAFSNGAYEVTETSAGFIQPCTAEKTNFTNFTFEIQMTIKSGGTGEDGGILFRADMNTDKLYLFLLGSDGTYSLGVRANSSGKSNRTLKSGTVSNFATGFDQVHTIGLVVNGTQMSIYVDQNLVNPNPISDPTYAGGQIGVVADYGTSSTTVDYNNARVWQL